MEVIPFPAGEEPENFKVVAINERREVAGYGKAAFLWRKDRWLPLGPPSKNSRAGYESRVMPSALNDFSSVVGQQGTGMPIFMSGLTEDEPFLWKGTKVIPIIKGIGNTVECINNKGDIVDIADRRGLTHVRGKTYILSTLSHVPAGNVSSLCDINDRRQMVGYSTYGAFNGNVDLPLCPILIDGSHLPLKIKRLPMLKGSTYGRALAINEKGTILVTGDQGSYLIRGKTLTKMNIPVEGYLVGYLNDRDEVAGMLNQGPETRMLFTWQQGKMSPLPSIAGWTFQSIHGLTNRGEILVTGTSEGVRKIAILTPVH